jgi:hypothetical protein
MTQKPPLCKVGDLRRRQTSDLLGVQTRDQPLDQLAHRRAPVAATAAAGKVARGVVHGRNGLVLVSVAGKSDRQIEVAESLTDSGGSPKRPH